MAEQARTLTRQDLEAKIIKRCWEDEAFRQEFTADPAGAFVKYLQVQAASLPKVVVHQEALGSWHIVLPTKPANADELSEADLEKVAGGGGTLIQVPVQVLIGAASTGAVATAGAAISVAVSVVKGW
jgi:hypothetical protein